MGLPLRKPLASGRLLAVEMLGWAVSAPSRAASGAGKADIPNVTKVVGSPS